MIFDIENLFYYLDCAKINPFIVIHVDMFSGPSSIDVEWYVDTLRNRKNKV